MKTKDEIAAWMAINEEHLQPCALCGELGLPAEFSDRQDDHEFAPILVRYRNADSRMDGELLDDECTSEMDRRMFNIEEATTRRFQSYRR